MHRSVIESLQAPRAIGPYSQAIAVPASRMVFLSGRSRSTRRPASSSPGT